VIVLRDVLGAELRRRRVQQGRTLLDVSTAARVSLGYLSEVERGLKEVSSECLAAICTALRIPMSGLLASVAAEVSMLERHTVVALPASAGTSEPDAADAPATPTPEAPGTDDDPNILSGPNTRIRAGNAMQRARAGAIRGALETLARRGLKRLTMAEAADRGGLARATLYNHVRDKDQLLALLLEHESQAVADAFVAAPDLEAALTAAASMVAEHPALVGLREHEPTALVRLAVPETGAVRTLAALALEQRGCSATEANVELLLRWLGSFVASPSDAEVRSAQAAALARTLA